MIIEITVVVIILDFRKALDTISCNTFLDNTPSAQLNYHGSIFINDVDAGLKGIISKFAYDTKLGRPVDSPKEKEAL